MLMLVVLLKGKLEHSFCEWTSDFKTQLELSSVLCVNRNLTEQDLSVRSDTDLLFLLVLCVMIVILRWPSG